MNANLPNERLVDSFLGSKTPLTRRAYEQDLNDFRLFLNLDTAEEAARQFIENGHGRANGLADGYRAHLMQRNLSSATVNRRLAMLRSLVKTARKLDVIQWWLDVDRLPVEPYRDTSGPGQPGVQKLLWAALSQRSPRRERDAALVRLLYDLALRRAETTSLDLEHVDLQGRTLRILGKGHRERLTMSLPVKTVGAVEAWLKVRGDEPGPLFLNVARNPDLRGRLSGRGLHRVITGLAERAGLKKTSPHAIRHAACTEAVIKGQAAGIPFEEIMTFTRHKTLQVVLRYRDGVRNMQGALSELVSGGV